MRKAFLRVLKFLQIKEGGPNFWVEPILQKVWIIWSHLLNFKFKSFMDPNSFSFIWSQCILHDWGVLFSESLNFYKFKRGKPILQKVWINSSPFLYLNFKRFVDADSLSFLRFQCILHDSEILLSEPWNFYKLKRGDLISRGNQFYRMSELFGPPFCIYILKFLCTEIPRHSLDFSPLCMNQEGFSQTCEICTN